MAKIPLFVKIGLFLAGIRIIYIIVHYFSTGYSLGYYFLNQVFSVLSWFLIGAIIGWIISKRIESKEQGKKYYILRGIGLGLSIIIISIFAGFILEIFTGNHELWGSFIYIDFIGIFLFCNGSICPDEGGLIHFLTAPISWMLIGIILYNWYNSKKLDKLK